MKKQSQQHILPTSTVLASPQFHLPKRQRLLDDGKIHHGHNPQADDATPSQAPMPEAKQTISQKEKSHADTGDSANSTEWPGLDPPRMWNGDVVTGASTGKLRTQNKRRRHALQAAQPPPAVWSVHAGTGHECGIEDGSRRFGLPVKKGHPNRLGRHPLVEKRWRQCPLSFRLFRQRDSKNGSVARGHIQRVYS
mmetsp:Transcript_23712/g.50039  ORF Transcript_23712/g.50039 Transcript_23712/m.50039 type:complete len:194 (-) Transcript_23712:397-978(-)